MFKRSFIACFFVFLTGIPKSEAQSIEITNSQWLGTLQLNDSVSLPFNFRLVRQNTSSPKMEIFNASEKINVPQKLTLNDSAIFEFPVFDSRIIAKINSKTMNGTFVNDARTSKKQIPFVAQQGIKTRYKSTHSKIDVGGTWEVYFDPSNNNEKAIGKFYQKENVVTGTFLTETGDYRFLEGAVRGDSLLLSVFDGAHAFVFAAKWEAGILTGGFWSGSHFYTDWVATRNDTVSLTDPYTLTYLNPGYDRFDFSFPDVDSNLVSLQDPRFTNKVVVVQIMGSWCPNCLDETGFLSDYYNHQKPEGVEIVALAFEKADSFSKATTNLARLQARFDIKYPMLVAGLTNNKAAVSLALPALNHLMSYPTTLFIDKKGVVRRIHTGFNGPATGDDYEKFKADFTLFVSTLAGE